jgi:hypothetical protein
LVPTVVFRFRIDVQFIEDSERILIASFARRAIFSADLRGLYKTGSRTNGRNAGTGPSCSANISLQRHSQGLTSRERTPRIRCGLRMRSWRDRARPDRWRRAREVGFQFGGSRKLINAQRGQGQVSRAWRGSSQPHGGPLIAPILMPQAWTAQQSSRPGPLSTLRSSAGGHDTTGTRGRAHRLPRRATLMYSTRPLRPADR